MLSHRIAHFAENTLSIPNVFTTSSDHPKSIQGTLMKSFRIFTTLLALCLLLSGCSSFFQTKKTAALSGHVTGSVTYRERVALPPGAKVIVSLEDVTRTNRSGEFVAQQTMQPTSQVPIAFDLRYLPQAIDLEHRYAVSAAIVDDREELLWSSAEAIPVVLTASDKPLAIVVERVSNPDTASARAPKAVPFKCDTISLIAKFGKDNVTIMLPGRSVTLPQVVSASGARYSDGSTTFWNKGDEALFEMNDVSYKGCHVDTLPPVSEPVK